MHNDIFCPRCAWHPQRESRWTCHCGHDWNTFTSGGTCTRCGIRYEDTSCPACHHSSPHREWYHGHAKTLFDAAQSAHPWEILCQSGVRCGGLELLLGQHRETARALLSEHLQFVPTNFAENDDYVAIDHHTRLRLHFEGDVLEGVEFTAGDVRYEGVPMLRGATWSTLEASLGEKGFAFDAASQLADGKECGALGVNVATHADVGGDPNDQRIEWVILSKNIR